MEAFVKTRVRILLGEEIVEGVLRRTGQRYIIVGEIVNDASRIYGPFGSEEIDKRSDGNYEFANPTRIGINEASEGASATVSLDEAKEVWEKYLTRV